MLELTPQECEADDFFCRRVAVEDQVKLFPGEPLGQCHAWVPTEITERLVVLCGAVSYEELRPEDLAKLRTRVCETTGRTKDEADRLPLDEAMNLVRDAAGPGEADLPRELSGTTGNGPTRGTGPPPWS